MGRYIGTGDITQTWTQLIATGGAQVGELEWFVQAREDEVDGRLGRYYDVSVWSGSAPPMVKTLVRIGASVDYRTSKITMEDPSVSAWITQHETKFETLITALMEGKMDLVSGSGTIIDRRQALRDMIWSSTKPYKPTMDLRSVPEQRVSRSRLVDERNADLADSGDIGEVS